MKHFLEKITHSFTDALPRARKTAWWIIKIMLPLSLAVGLLQYFSLLPYLSDYLAPLFKLIGLSGDASIAFISSVFVSCYAPIAIISSLNLEMREIIILGAMCVISHNMIFECAVQKKTGSNPYLIFTVRLAFSFIAAIFLNVVLPENESFNKAHFSQVYHAPKTLVDFFINWSISNGLLVIRIILIIFSLMFLQNILRNFSIINWLSKSLAPVMKVMGLSPNTSFLWLVGQIVGLAYGSAILIDEIKKGEISRSETTRLNYHLALNHSQLEDPMLFVAIGAPFFWVSLPRYIFSVLLVWIIVLAQKIKHKYTAVQ
ncbi:MAG: nucleoside recognition protein [Paludibacteraceae bacterium]|nr:nucleoside recognition protein [Paludibacteraceae bacterium]MBN2788425.1 nucleoside recognition protein [Paludibacteraceae bacterium]